MSQLSSILSAAVDGDLGILNGIMQVTLQPKEPDVWIFVADYADPLCLQTFDRASPRRVPKRQGSGAGLDREAALWATVGECIERYAAAIIAEDRLVRASEEDLSAPHLDPSAVIRFSDAQYERPGFPFVRYDPRARRAWVDGVNLTTGSPAFVPASMVYMYYESESTAENLDKGYSTGLAAGSSLASAAVTALREVVERDAFACHWLSSTPPPVLNADALRTALPEGSRRLLEVPGLTYDLRDLTTEFEVPCVLVQVRSTTSPGVCIGSSCHLSAAKAAEKALVEAFHTFNWVLEMVRWNQRIEREDQIVEFADHVAYYLEPSRFPKLAPFFAAAPASALRVEKTITNDRSDAADLQELISRLARRGYETYLVDITPPDVAELGLCVVRAIVPGLQPLYAGHAMYHLDRRRLQKFAAWRGAPLPAELNLAPHAFP